MIALLVSIGLCLQYAAFSLCRSMLHDTTPVYTVLFYVELLKLVVSFFMARRQLDKFCARPLAILVPVLCFMLMNIASYIVVTNVPATVYVMVMQLKLPATYVCSYFTLSKKMTLHQTFAVAFICISCANIAQRNPIGNQVESIYILGMLFETALSALSTVYMQKVFENNLETLWIRNVEMSVCSLPAYAALILYNDYSWRCTSIGYLFSCLGAIGGVLVALTLIYTDAVAKTISSSISVLLVTLCEHVIYREVPSVAFASFFTVALLSVLLYSSSAFEQSEVATYTKFQELPLLQEDTRN
jgi:drug/metabolite transporter (DMT)-like permease